MKKMRYEAQRHNSPYDTPWHFLLGLKVGEAMFITANVISDKRGVYNGIKRLESRTLFLFKKEKGETGFRVTRTK